MNKTVFLAILALALPGAEYASGKIHHNHSTGQSIVIYDGLVDAKSAERFTALIARNVDKIVGLKLAVERSADSDKRYYVGLSGNSLNVTSGDPLNAPAEMIIHDGLGTTSAGELYTIDGFYIIKSGGSHAAGALSFGATPVSEATVRLNPNVRLITQRF